MIDLHTHSLFSDGVLVPSELVRRAVMKGYEVIAITDHADASNLDFIIPRVASVCEELGRRWKITALPGIELTHIPPETFAELTERARSLGAPAQPPPPNSFVSSTTASKTGAWPSRLITQEKTPSSACWLATKPRPSTPSPRTCPPKRRCSCLESRPRSRPARASSSANCGCPAVRSGVRLKT